MQDENGDTLQFTFPKGEVVIHAPDGNTKTIDFGKNLKFKSLEIRS